MRMLIHLLGALQRSPISSPRSHHSSHLLMILCQSVVVEDRAGFVGLLVVWCWTPWGWRDEAQAALGERGWAELHSNRSRLVSRWERRGLRGRDAVDGLHFGRGRQEQAAGGVVLLTTCWAVDSRMTQWCRVASTAVPLPQVVSAILQ